jgi:hypothetical protein
MRELLGLSPPRRPIAVYRWVTGGGSGVRVMLFSSFPSPQVPHKGRSLLLYKFDTRKYALPPNQSITRLE